VGSDIKNGKRTLMVVHAFQRLEGEERNRFLSVLGNQRASQEEVRNAIALLDSVDSTIYAENMAHDFAKKSKELLGVLKNSEHKEILSKITDYMVERKK
jgi:geranylgeranyl diphosphate synthase type I